MAAPQFTVKRKGTEIVTWSPPETAGTVAVEVVTPVGTSAASRWSRFQFVAPTITSVKPGSGPVKGGTKVIIAGAGLQNATSVKFGPRPALRFQVNAKGTRITATAPPESPGTVRLKVVTPTGHTKQTGIATYTFG